MEPNKSADFKSNVADLTKIPPNEFEKYFQDWMERDDVARSLQAKLRCDLIKNFNKTNLGKHIISHTMSSMGGSTMRLTLSPLVLSLNTLVAEFLYAQNCHFTLSVFCTEIPFRNTLPDFESMRRFRFNNEEICEIWQAVTGSKASIRDLNKNIIQIYETNPNMSLLLLIIKCLIKRDPLEQLKRNAEVQTEIQEKAHKSISAQVSEQEKKVSAKDDNLRHINQYLLTLSEKVIEMTREFEQFAKQRHESRSRTLKSTRSREYYTLNKSLERITENMKAMAQAKRKNKRLSSIVESIDNLTQQFGKCAQNFDNVTKVLSSRDDKPAEEKTKRNKAKFTEKQTETEVQEKSYAEWIYEMRNTENGQKFLNRVEIALRKALTKHREQLQGETDIKMKHLKSLMRLHYQQKLSKHLLLDPKINLEETRKCNDNIEKKLQQFELKQMELLHKLKESSSELREAQQQQKESAVLGMEEKIHEKVDILKSKNIQTEAELEVNSKEGAEDIAKTPINPLDQPEPQKLVEDVRNRQETAISKTIQLDIDRQACPLPDHRTTAEAPELLLRDVSKAQKEILDVAKTIAEQGRSVDHIIYDAKLRIQQLENESNQLEQNFQSYLERRKRDQEQQNRQEIGPNLKENISAIEQIIQTRQITSARLLKDRKKPHTLLEEERDEEIDEEFRRLKETLQHSHEQNDKPAKSAKSDSSTSSLEIRNAILEAKLKFFEHENTIRKCREQGDEIRSGNLLQKHLEKYPEIYELPDYFNQNFGQFDSETNINFCETEHGDRVGKELHLESSLSEINIKDKTLDEEHNIELSPMTEVKSQKAEDKTPTSVRRQLFAKSDERNTLETGDLVRDLKHNIRHHEPIPRPRKDLEEAIKSPNEFGEIRRQPTETTSHLIRQSMAKMQQLFEQQSKSKETLREMVNEIAQERDLQCEYTHIRPKEALDKSLTTTVTTTTTASANVKQFSMGVVKEIAQEKDLPREDKKQLHIRPNEALDKSLTSTTTTTTNTNQTSEKSHLKNLAKMQESVTTSKRSSNNLRPSMLNLSSASEESLDSDQLEIEMSADTIKEIAEEQETKRDSKKPLEEVVELTDSSETSELLSLPSPAQEKSQEPKTQLQQEFGQILDSPNLAALKNVYSPVNDKEIGEIFSESNRTFAPIDAKLSERFSTSSSSDLEISTGDQNKNVKNLGDDSESDFWA